MWQLDRASARNFWRVFAFAMLAHGLDLGATYWRDPDLTHERNPSYLLMQSAGVGGWGWLLGAVAAMVVVLSAAYWWYLSIRPRYLPKEAVSCPRSLIWRGMWDGKPYPKTLWPRLYNRRKLKFATVVMAGLCLPGSAAAALYYALDNAAAALGHELPRMTQGLFIPLATVGLFLWWYWAYWHYYQTEVASAPDSNDPGRSAHQSASEKSLDWRAQEVQAGLLGDPAVCLLRSPTTRQ